jgi:hypothetical protein
MVLGAGPHHHDDRPTNAQRIFNVSIIAGIIPRIGNSTIVTGKFEPGMTFSINPLNDV